MVTTTRVLAEHMGSVSELKKNPMGFVQSGQGEPVAVLNRNEPAFYCVPADLFEAMMDAVEDAELSALIQAREGQRRIRVSLDEL